MQTVKNELALPNPSLAQGSRAEAIPAPAENRITLVARRVGDLFHTKFEAWVSTTPEDATPNIKIQHLSAAVLSATTPSLLARQQEVARQMREQSNQS